MTEFTSQTWTEAGIDAYLPACPCTCVNFESDLPDLSVVFLKHTCSVGLFVYFLRPGKSIKSYGPWAIITGATDGIGRAYADALAKKGKVAQQNLQGRMLCGNTRVPSESKIYVRLHVRVMKRDLFCLEGWHFSMRECEQEVPVQHSGKLIH